MNTKFKNFVWLQTAFPGDIVLTTSAIHWLRRQDPDCKQYMITSPAGMEILSGHPDLDGIIAYDKSRQKGLGAMGALTKKVKLLVGTGSTLLLRPHLSTRSALLGAMLRYPSLSFHEASLSMLSRLRVHRSVLDHETIRIAKLLEPVLEGSNTIPRQLRPFLPKKPLRPALEERLKPLSAFKLVGLAPGSVWPTKRFSPEGFAAIASRILEQRSDCAFVLLGSPDDADAAALIAAECRAPDRVINLIGHTKLGDLTALVPQLSLMICNDSAPIHFASAYNVPTIAVFGATVTAQGFGPLSEQSFVAQNLELECRPCGDHGHQKCPLGHFKCMKDISITPIVEKAVQFI